MIHKIHMGEELSQQPYLLGGFPPPSESNPAGRPIDFGEVLYPTNPGDCSMCHFDGTYSLPPVQASLATRLTTRTCTEATSDDADDYCDDPFWRITSTTYLPPATAICSSCHDTPDTLAHAELNTTADGLEACGTCRGPGSDGDVEAVHRDAVIASAILGACDGAG